MFEKARTLDPHTRKVNDYIARAEEKLKSSQSA
jgi:hypothetical protein